MQRIFMQNLNYFRISHAIEMTTSTNVFMSWEELRLTFNPIDVVYSYIHYALCVFENNIINNSSFDKNYP